MVSFLEIIKKRKYLYLIMILFIISILALIGMSKTFSLLEPVKSINITSSNLSYENNEPGSWNIEKSAKWTSSGKARITFDLDTVLRTQNNKYVDIILVLDVSGSMYGDKLNKVKNDSIELIDKVLNDSRNRIGLITFESKSVLVSQLTNDKDAIIGYINSLWARECTNYYRALENVDNILKNYTKEDDRDCIVLFLTDGEPNRDTPNEVGEYNYLKDTYPYVTINGVQYEMGDTVLDPIKKISDNQYIASMDTLNNVIFDASVAPIKYDNVEIVDYIDNNYFDIDSIDDIYSNIGEVNLDGNKVTWTINEDFKSGDKANLTIDVRLKDEYLNVGGTYPTNIKEEVKVKIEDDIENITSTDTPVLADNYIVTYDGNAPSGCSVNNKPVDEVHSVFTTVKKSEVILECEGYIFKGWDIVTEDVERVNDDYFIMPESNVILRAKWSSLTINKSMDGTIAQVRTLYGVMRDNAVLDNVNSTYVNRLYKINNISEENKEKIKAFIMSKTNYPPAYYDYCVEDSACVIDYIIQYNEENDPDVEMEFENIRNTPGIDFSKASSDTNGKGIYIRSGTENNINPIYYYRGAVENNNVYFANYCWKIVRTTETGGIKMIYNGVLNERGNCQGVLQYYDSDADSLFSTTSDSVSQKGSLSTIGRGNYSNFDLNDINTMKYTYNNNGVETDSPAKSVIDTWYQANILTNYDNYIEDTIYCNDTSIHNTNEFSTDEITNYYLDYHIAFGSMYRIIKGIPSLECPTASDAYSKSISIGNGKLTYSVGMLTLDEVVLSGITLDYVDVSGAYLNNSDDWGTMSPYEFRTDDNIYDNGTVVEGFLSNNSIGGPIRPVISLKPGTRIDDGDGTFDNPYIIEME